MFCRIVAGTLPSQRAYEDDRAVAFADIKPAAPVHLLVVPRRHVAGLMDLTDEESDLAGHLVLVASKLGRAMCPGGWRLVFNVGREGGQTVDHLHVHLLGGRELGPLGLG